LLLSACDCHENALSYGLQKRCSESGDDEKPMTHLQQTIKAVIRQGEESGYVAECIEVAVVTQGQTIDEMVANLKEAVALHLEAEAPATFSLRERPTLVIRLEVHPT
jgi:predicted RNase H-like HicB family nuclease